MTDFRIIDIEQWERKEQFQFFKEYDNPFFGLTADVEVSKLLEFTRSRGYSFFAAYLYISQLQVNKIKEFRYRIVDGQVLDYAKISAGSTVLKTNEVFTFCYLKNLKLMCLSKSRTVVSLKVVWTTRIIIWGRYTIR